MGVHRDRERLKLVPDPGVQHDMQLKNPWIFCPATRSFESPHPLDAYARLRGMFGDFNVEAYTAYVPAAELVRTILPKVEYAGDFCCYILSLRFRDLGLARLGGISSFANVDPLDVLPLNVDGVVLPFEGPGARIKFARRPELAAAVREVSVARVFPERASKVA